MLKMLFAVLAGCVGTPTMAQEWSGTWVALTEGYGTGRFQQGVSALGELGAVVDVRGAMPGLRYARTSQEGNVVHGFDIGISGGIDGLSPMGTGGADWLCGTGDCTVDIRLLVTARGRLGVLVTPATQIYLAAGVAIARVEGGIFDSEQQGRSTASGYTIGLGLERMLSDRMTAFAEVNRVDLGPLEFGTGGLGHRYDALGAVTTITLGVTWRF